MAFKKFDYDSEEFYDELSNLAMQGMKVSEMAYALADRFGVSLNPVVLNEMKTGCYQPWNAEENARRGQKISEAIARGRERVTSIVRGRYLKAALGGIKIKGKSTRKRHLIVDGQPTEDMVVEVVENEQETPPNIKALSRWLYQNDPEWRRVQRGTETDDLPFDPKKGVSIRAWIEKEISADSKGEE